MNLIDGKKIAQDIKNELPARVQALKAQGVVPGLATILVGDDPASHVYVASKIKACAELGLKSFNYNLKNTSKENDIIKLIEELNNNKEVHGILLQIPLPKGLSSDVCIASISPRKDIDGLHPESIGQFVGAKSWEEIEKKKLFIPCTPLGIVSLLLKYNIEVSGKNAIVIGRSNLVGKPIAMLLLSLNATVTIAHSKTKDIEGLCKQADIIVAAIGRQRYVNEKFVKPGAVIIDVGINRTDNGICGDVDFDKVKDIASYITPVPGGVGRMTIAMLMNNTILAAEKSL